MKKNIIKSNAAIVLFGQSPAWTTGQDTVDLFSLVQNCDFSITADRQKTKQVGRQTYGVNAFVKAPEVAMNMDYYLTPYMSNEGLLGFGVPSAGYMPAIPNIKSQNNNIYMVIDKEDTRDGLSQFRSPTLSYTSFSGFDAISFGNCYLNKYSVSFSLSQVPKVSVSFGCSNARFENLTDSKISIPAINSVSGNNVGSGFLDLSGAYISILDNSGIADPVANPSASSFSLQNLQMGGVGLSQLENPILQSFSMHLDLARTNLYGLGSNYVFDRKLQYPINGQAQISCLVSGVNSGNLDSFLSIESGYSFEVAFCDSKKLNTGYYRIENAKLDSVNYSMQVNNAMTFDASFSFEVNDTGGFFMKTSYAIPSRTWSNIDLLWQNLDVHWQDL